MPSDSQTRAEQQRRRRAAQAIAKGRRPGVIGRPPASPAEKAAGAVIQKIVEHLDDLFKPSEVADVESFLVKIMGEYEPSDNSDEYHECIYRSLEGDEPIDGEEPELSFANGVEPMTAPAAPPRRPVRRGCGGSSGSSGPSPGASSSAATWVSTPLAARGVSASGG